MCVCYIRSKNNLEPVINHINEKMYVTLCENISHATKDFVFNTICAVYTCSYSLKHVHWIVVQFQIKNLVHITSFVI